MDITNADIVWFSDTESLPQTNQMVWWVLAIVEVLLCTRFFLELFNANTTHYIVSVLYQITDYFMYPFSIVFGSGIGGSGFIELTAIMAIITYSLLAIVMVHIFKARRSPRSRIEHARALSRKKYGR